MGNEVSIKAKKKQEKWSSIHSNKLSGIYYHRTETWKVSQLRSNPPAVHYKKETRSREQETAPGNPHDTQSLCDANSSGLLQFGNEKGKKGQPQSCRRPASQEMTLRLPCSERWHNKCLFDHTQHKIQKAKFSLCLKNKNLQASNEINMSFLGSFFC